MRRLLLILISAILLQACSVLDFLPAPAIPDTPTATFTPTASLTPTITLTPTRTTTPTPRNTATLIISDFNTPVILATEPAITEPPISTLTPSAPIGGFESIDLSLSDIFYGTCKHNYTKMTIKVEHPEEISKVYIFFRLESGKKPGDTSPWTGSITDNDGGGYFLYTLRANQIPERRNFLKAWVHYQFVAENADGKIVGRSQVYTRNLLLEACR